MVLTCDVLAAEVPALLRGLESSSIDQRSAASKKICSPSGRFLNQLGVLLCFVHNSA